MVVPRVVTGGPWSDEEHKAFLEGLDFYGKGRWKSISVNFVPTRSPTQVASHAQKYYMRIEGKTKRGSKFTVVEKNRSPKPIVKKKSMPMPPVPPMPPMPLVQMPMMIPFSLPFPFWCFSSICRPLPRSAREFPLKFALESTTTVKTSPIINAGPTSAFQLV